MQKIKLLIILLIVFSCKKKEPYISQYPTEVNWKPAQDYYLSNLDLTIRYLDSLKNEGLYNKKTKFYFSQARVAFKKTEPYVGYLNPEVAHKTNGPALPVFKEDSGKVIAPIGLQKLEETIYEKGSTPEAFNIEINIIKGLCSVLKRNIKTRPLNPQRFFVATHQQLMRLVSLSMSGFDTPVSGLSISETAVSLQGLKDVYNLTIKNLIIKEDKSLDSLFDSQIAEAIQFVNKDSSFENFDRYTFIRNFLNPITTTWVTIRKKSKLWNGSKAFPFNFDAPTFFEEDSFNSNFFAKTNNRFPTDKKIALGKVLFFDKRISKNGTMSCATCHNPKKGYADGLALGTDNSGKLLQRNTPTLLNSSFQKGFFWDGRSGSLESQITAVFNNKKEFNNSAHQFSNAILTDSTYVLLFKNAYGNAPTSNKAVIKAISSYVATLKSFNSKFDKNIRGEANNFSQGEKRGFNLFMGKALCATCHFMPLTNGTVPPFFSETEKEVIGVPETTENKILDDDTGFYFVFKKALHKGMFKTPTVRNAELTAPYMHNGVYNTLQEVIEFYVQGGGAGLGFDLPHQTLPFDKLELTNQDQKDLIAFITTLTDVPEEY